MSKAFVRETAYETELANGDGLPDDAPAIPVGVKNYMTPLGHRRMQDELRQLRVERPQVVETVAWVTHRPAAFRSVSEITPGHEPVAFKILTILGSEAQSRVRRSIHV